MDQLTAVRMGLNDARPSSDDIRQRAIDDVFDAIERSSNRLEVTAAAFGRTRESGTDRQAKAASQVLLIAKREHAETLASVKRIFASALHESEALVARFETKEGNHV